MRKLNVSHLHIKTPDKDDLLTLLPAFTALLVWALFAKRAGHSSTSLLLPTLVAVIAWVLLKGLRYVPE